MIALWYVFVQALPAQTVSSTDTLKSYTMHATYYSDKFVGRRTSCGEIFRQDRYTAAHHTFKFGTLLLVTNPSDGSQVIVRVNDRCPRNNVVDMTKKAAKQIGVGSRSVKVQVLPERFYPYWELQDQLTEVMKEGRLLEYASSQTPVPAQNEKDDNLFDIELFRCESRGVAKNLTKNMPVHYQGNVSYVYADTSGELKAILELSVERGKAEAVRKELEAMFPDAKIVPSR